MELKYGMEVKNASELSQLVLADCDSPWVVVWVDGVDTNVQTDCLTHYRWPNGDGTWLPIEGEPEIISMEGVE